MTDCSKAYNFDRVQLLWYVEIEVGKRMNRPSTGNWVAGWDLGVKLEVNHTLKGTQRGKMEHCIQELHRFGFDYVPGLQDTEWAVVQARRDIVAVVAVEAVIVEDDGAASAEKGVDDGGFAY